ncbi:MAG: DsbA family protein [Candidatus Sungbacteria bacterium]|nr:DsbA family protein [Candidatus Sungbacteria bacterium]
MEDQNAQQYETPQATPEVRPTPNPLLVPIAIIIAGALIGGSVLYSNSSRRPAPQLGAANTGKAVDNAELLKQAQNDSRSLGNPDAPVTIVEFADFQCPFCGKFFRESGTKIIDQYVKTGKVRFVYRDFAFLGPESTMTAEASRCAQDQQAFWQYHDYVFSHQQGENQGAFSKENLKGFAAILKLDTQKFNACLDTGTHRDEVQKDLELGRSLGVDGTPSTFVNDKFFNGALPFEEFKKAIEAELAK